MRLFISIALILSLFAACTEERDHITLDLSYVTLDGEGNNQVVTFMSTAGSWSALSLDDWCQVKPSSGNLQSGRIILSADVNMTFAERETTVTISAPNADDATIIVKQEIPDSLDLIELSETEVQLESEASTQTITLNSTTTGWQVNEAASWLSITPESGEEGEYQLTLTATENTGGMRITYVSINGNSANKVTLKVTQQAASYPSYAVPIDADDSGMESNAGTLASKMVLGWNLGNSMEVPSDETAWGNPLTKKTLIDSVKAAGFNAIRIPCAWDSYIESDLTCKLKDSWLARVKEVVDYCVDNEMYAILNIHWDGGWLENNCTKDKQEENNAKQKALWEQIAMHFRDYDEHLLFAGTNEPNVSNSTEMAVLLSYEQTFVDAVRSTGGRNAYRVLVVQGPSTDIEKTNDLMNTLPTDDAENRMMVEVHYYTPWNFCGLESDASWGKMFYYWGDGYLSETDTERNSTTGEALVDSHFKLMKEKFVMKGVPVVLGEYGAFRRSTLTGDALELHLNSRAYYIKYVTQTAKVNGMIPFYWDNGYSGNLGFGIFGRSTGRIIDQLVVDALNEGAGN